MSGGEYAPALMQLGGIGVGALLAVLLPILVVLVLGNLR